MAGKCDLCGKTPSSGFNVSHSKRHTKRKWLPNLQKHLITVGDVQVRVRSCTKCLRTLQKER